MADVETPLPNLGGEGVDVFDGNIPEPGKPEGEGGEGDMMKQEFLDNLANLISSLSGDCQTEVNVAMSKQNYESLSDKCRAEFSEAAGKTPGFEKLQEAAIRNAADAARRNNGRQPNPNTKYYVSSALFIIFSLVVVYIVYVNKKLKEAGLLNVKRKNLSKKKLEKERIKQQQRKQL